MSAPKVLILMGGPGAGKGTQAARLSEHVGLAHISTGDLFRENQAKGTELGQRAKQYMEAGKLVPDELVLDMLFDRTRKPDCEEGYILDGFPRTLAQAEALDERLGDTPLQAIEIHVPDDVIVERIAGRLLCRDCGNIQHLRFDPPKAEGVCDACGGELYQREDDSADTVRERLAVYHESTAPVEDYYENAGVLRKIDGTKTPDEVFEALVAAMEEGA